VISRSTGRLRARRTRAEERRFQRETRKLWQSFEDLGIRREDFPSTEHAQREVSFTYGHLLTRGIVAPVASMVLMVIAVHVVSLVVWSMAHHYGLDGVARAAAYVHQQWGKAPDEAAAGRNPLFAGLAQLGLFGIALWVMLRTLRKGAIRKYWLTQRTGAAIVRCAEARAVPEIERMDQVRRVDSLCRAVEWSIWRSHMWRGGMPRRSPRRVAARRHAALVIAALRREEEKLSDRPDNAALDALAATLAKIGEQHAAGSATALLPTEDLDGVTAVSLRRQAFRESVAIARGLAAAMVAAFFLDPLLPELGVRDELVGWFLWGGAAIAAVLAAGWDRVREFLSIFPGS
jgi:hypothetical protein